MKAKNIEVLSSKYLLSLHKLQNEIQSIYLWLKGHDFELSYHIYRTSSKVYTFIISDIEALDMTMKCNESSQI